MRVTVTHPPEITKPRISEFFNMQELWLRCDFRPSQCISFPCADSWITKRSDEQKQFCEISFRNASIFSEHLSYLCGCEWWQVKSLGYNKLTFELIHVVIRWDHFKIFTVWLINFWNIGWYEYSMICSYKEPIVYYRKSVWQITCLYYLYYLQLEYVAPWE